MELLTDSETSGHRWYRFLSWDCFLQVPNYQDFQIISSRIKEVLLYNVPPCIPAEYSRNDTQLHATQGTEHHNSAETHLENNLDNTLDEVSSMNNLQYYTSLEYHYD